MRGQVEKLIPALAARLGCEPLAMLADREAEALMDRLTPLQRQRLAKRLLEGDAEGDGQGSPDGSLKPPTATI